MKTDNDASGGSRRPTAKGWNNLIPGQFDWEARMDDLLFSTERTEEETTKQVEEDMKEESRMNIIQSQLIQINQRPRFLTHREAARLMGFSNNFQILRENDPSGPGTALFGNAVTPPIIGAIAACMLRAHGIEFHVIKSEYDDYISSHSCVGGRVAMIMTLETIPKDVLWRREMLAHRMNRAVVMTSQLATSMTGGGGGGGGGESVTMVEDENCCYDYRATGKCEWGDKCRFSHSAT